MHTVLILLLLPCGLENMVMAQASFNALKTLPAAMGQLPRLELMRVAVNCIEQVVTQPVLLCKYHLRT